MERKVSSLWYSLDRVKSFGGQMWLTTGTQVLMILLGLVTGVLTARLLGPEGRGALAAIQIWPSFFAGVALLGLPEALTYYSAQVPKQAGRALGSAVALGLLLSVPFMGIGYCMLPFLLSAQPVAVIAAARWYLLLLPLTALIGTPYCALRGRGDFFVWNVLRLAPGLGWLVVICLAWTLGPPEPGVMALGYVVMLALISCPVIYIVTRRVAGPFWPDPQQWRPMLHYGLYSTAGSVPQVLNLRLDQMVMAGLLPAHMLGLYVVAVTWSGAVAPLLNALGTVLFPRIAAQPSPEQQRRVFTQGSRAAIFAAGMIAMVVMLFTPCGVTLLFGKNFTPVIPAALVLVLAAAIAGINLVLEEGLRGLGKPEAVPLAECGGLVVTVAALLLLLRPLGIMGAALASVFGYGAVTILLVVQVRRLTGYSLSSFLRPTRQDVYLGWQQSWTLIASVRSK